MIISPQRASWRRWRDLSSQDHTLLRAMENERIRGLELRGRTLDFGGGQKFGHYSLLTVDGEMDSVNINPKVNPTFIADLNKPLPIGSDVYDNVISFNTFEHIDNDVVAVQEMIRVLKPGGRFVMTVPFLYRIHSLPRDYHRHIAFWWDSFLSSIGAVPGVSVPRCFPPAISHKGACCMRRLVSGIDITAQTGW